MLVRQYEIQQTKKYFAFCSFIKGKKSKKKIALDNYCKLSEEVETFFPPPPPRPFDNHIDEKKKELRDFSKLYTIIIIYPVNINLYSIYIYIYLIYVYINIYARCP